MAAISPNVSSEPQLGTGSKTDFAFNFSIVAATDIGVYVDGVRKAYPADYSVTFGNVSGTVTFTAAPANAAVILLVSEPDYLQASDFADQGAYNLSTVNTINRRAAIRELVNHDLGTRALKVPRGEDAEGPEIPLSDVSSIVAVGDSLIAGSDIPSVAGALTNIGLVAGSIANVNTVAGIHAAVSTVSGVAAAVSTVSGITGNVTAVAGIAANVTTVAGVSGSISTLAPIAANITTVAGISGAVTTVSGISANVSIVASIAANVTTVAGISANVTSVTGALTNINAVATNIAAVNIVATNIAAVNTCSTNIAAIIAAPTAAASISAALPIKNNALSAFLQLDRLSNATRNGNGTATFTTFGVWGAGTLPREWAAARDAGTGIQFWCEYVSGAALSSVYLRQYLGVNSTGGQIGSNIQLVGASGDFMKSIVLDPACLSLDIVANSAGTATVRDIGGGVVAAARPVVDPNFLVSQGRAVALQNRATAIPFQYNALTGVVGTPTLANGVLTIPSGASGAMTLFFIGSRLANGSACTIGYAASFPPGNVAQTGTLVYDAAGGSGPLAGHAQVYPIQVGNGMYRWSDTVDQPAGAANTCYGFRLTFNNTSAITLVLSDFTAWASANLPVLTEVPAVVESRIGAVAMAESDAGPLIRRFTILADSVFHQTDLTGPTPVTTAKRFLGDFGRIGDRARLRNLAIPGSGLRAMLSHAGLPPTTVSLPSDTMPASGSVTVSSWSGDPITAFYGANPEFSRIFYLRGVKVLVSATSFHANLWPNVGTLVLTRLEAGDVVPVPPGSKLISEQAFMMRDDFVALEGSINPSNPSMTVLQGAAAFFAARDAQATARGENPATVIKSLFMPALMSVPGVTPLTQNTGHANTAALVASYGVDRILDLNAPGIPGGNYLSADEAAFMAAIGWTASGSDNAYMVLGWRPPSMAPDTYHPDDYCDQLLGRRFALCNAVQNYMENVG